MINYNEIPKANTGIGNQDTFELFARDFLKQSGYQIISEPSRGADGGLDILVHETRLGISGQTTTIKWLVSCKHYSHSGQSITPTIENNILDRLAASACDGFIGFYSTIPSSGLTTILDGISIAHGKSYEIYDSKKIESEIIGYPSMESIFLRFFPISYKKWKELYYLNEPVNLFNYYYKKEYENKLSVFDSLFGQPENILKALRNTNDFKTFIEYTSVKYFTVELNDYIIELEKTNQELILENKKGKAFNNIFFTIHNLLSPLLSKKFKIELLPETKLFLLNSQTKNGLGISLLFANALFVNDEQSEFLQSEYKLLKEILN